MDAKSVSSYLIERPTKKGDIFRVVQIFSRISSLSVRLHRFSGNCSHSVPFVCLLRSIGFVNCSFSGGSIVYLYPSQGQSTGMVQQITVGTREAYWLLRSDTQPVDNRVATASIARVVISTKYFIKRSI